MILNPVLVLIGVAAVILTRSAYRFLNPEWTNTDAFVHFNIIREIRSGGHRIPAYHSKSFHPGKFTYPPALHLLLSFLPERYYEAVDRVFSPAVDLVFAGLLLSLVPAGMLDLTGAAVALALFAATPQFTRPDHPHGVGLSARKPGVILCNISLVAFLSWTAGGGPGALAVALVTGALLALTSMFSVQAFLFVGLVLGAVHTPVAVGYVVTSLVLAVVISGGYYLRVLRGHIWFSLDYAKEKQYKFLYDGFKSINTVRRFFGAIQNRSPRAVAEALFDSIVLRSLFDNPFLILALVAIALGVPAAVPEGYTIWLAAGLATFVVTSFYHLRFLGHAGRYLEYIFFPGAVVVAASYGERGMLFNWLVYATVAGGLAIIVTYVIIQQGWTDQSEREAFTTLLDRLRDLPPGRVLIQPRYKGSEVAWRTEHSVNDFLGNGYDAPEVVAERNRLYPKKEGWVTDDVSWLASEFDPDWVVFDRTVAENAPPGALSEPDRQPRWESEAYALYNLKS